MATDKIYRTNRLATVPRCSVFELRFKTESWECYFSFSFFFLDFLDYIFIIILVLIISIVSFGTYYHKNHTLDSRNDNKTIKIIAKSFSIKKNWERFISKPNTDIAKDFVYIHTIRVITICFIVFAHVFIGYNFAPSVNPEFIEEVSVSFKFGNLF